MKITIHVLTLLGLLILGTFAASSFAEWPYSEESSAKCLLEIKGVKYIDGICTYSKFLTDGKWDHSFQILDKDANGDITTFADLQVYNGVGSANWNGGRGANHAHDSLGDMKENGPCWENDEAKICVWESAEKVAQNFR